MSASSRSSSRSSSPRSPKKGRPSVAKVVHPYTGHEYSVHSKTGQRIVKHSDLMCGSNTDCKPPMRCNTARYACYTPKRVAVRVAKAFSPGKKRNLKCKEGKCPRGLVCSPKDRCVKKGGRVALAMGRSPRKSPVKERASRMHALHPEGSPPSGRVLSKSGKFWVLASNCTQGKACPQGKVCNPETRRCRSPPK